MEKIYVVAFGVAFIVLLIGIVLNQLDKRLNVLEKKTEKNEERIN